MKRESAGKKANPFRKRSFDAEHDVGLMLNAFEIEHPGTKLSWFFNSAIRKELAASGYAKRLHHFERAYRSSNGQSKAVNGK